MQRTAPRVPLLDLDPMIVVPAPTGIVYCDQVNGVACEYREVEGFADPHG